MWELDYKESWAPKNWCFWSVVLEKILASPLDCEPIHQSILKEISPECSLEGLMLKLKLQSFSHLMGRTDSFEKTLMLGKIDGGRRRGWQRMRWLDGITNLMDMSWIMGAGDGQGGLVCCSAWGCKESDTTEWLNWIEPTPVFLPREFHRQRSLVGYSPWGRKELDMTEQLNDDSKRSVLFTTGN